MVSGNQDYTSCPLRGIASYATTSDTNQRLEFDFDEHGKRLFACGVDKCVRTYDVQSGKLLEKLEGLGDVANGVSFASTRGNSGSGILAVATGARRFPDEDTDDERDASSREEMAAPGSLELYKLADKVEPTEDAMQ
jgi:WD40 repeat protein